MSQEAIKFCKKILPEVSRSFALSIPMLDEELKFPVLVTYLQDRLLDNFEDEISEDDISVENRKMMMDRVVELFFPDSEEKGQVIKEIESYAELMSDKSLQKLTENALFLRQAYDSLDNVVKELSYKWLAEMNSGMKKYLTKDVETFIDLDEYCYYVAGTVGGFLTDLIIYYSPISEQQSEILLANYNSSGLFLQKINLIRDIKNDIDNREKHYWPLADLNITGDELVNPANKEAGMLALKTMIEDVKNHIPNLINYYNAVPRKMTGYRRFYSLNNALGLATIEKMENNPDVLYGDKTVKVPKLEFLGIMKNPEKAFLDRVEEYQTV